MLLDDMASASEDDYSDDYHSDEEFDTAELVKSSRKSPRNSKTVSIKVPSAKTPRKPARRSGSPTRSGASRTTGAISSFAARKSVQELWNKKNMKNGGMSTGTKKSQKSRTAVEAWGENLRRSGAGISTESKANTMTGLNKSKSKDMSYASTSHYLRQLMGTEKSKKADLSASGRVAPGTPAYKSQEEYYDEIIELKKTITGMNMEQSTMRSKLRRLEEDNLKKEREIQNLLDPSKSDEIRRTLTDRKPDSSAVIHSLKQKILKLEQNLRDKESQYAKLQSDLKTTKIEEMKLQLETCYKEIVRLSTLKQAGALSARQAAREEKAAGPKMKALQETVLRMNEKNVRLQQDNKTLREDLEKLMETTEQNKAKNMEYEDMNKRQLMTAISKLEKKLDRAEADSTSLMSDIDDRRGKTEGKIALEGTMAQKLNQLDQRETELLEECQKQKGIVKKLKEDRAYYRKKGEEKDKEIKLLKKEVEEIQAELDEFYSKDKSLTPRSASRRSSTRTSPTRSRTGSRSRSPSMASDSSMRKADRDRLKRADRMRENHAARTIQRGWRSHQHYQQDEKRRQVKAMALRENHAAKVIQKEWMKYTHQKQERENEEATQLIQSAMRGHLSRKRNLSYLKDRSRGYHAEMDDEVTEDTETELDSAAEYIQSNVRGYKYHKEHISRSKKQFLDEGEYDSDIIEIQGAFRGHLARKSELRKSQKPPMPHVYRSPNISRKVSSSRSRLDSAGEEEDDEISRFSARGNRRSSGGSPRGSIRGKSPSTFSNRSNRSSRTPTRSQYSDDDDDIVLDTKRRGTSHGKYY